MILGFIGLSRPIYSQLEESIVLKTRYGDVDGGAQLEGGDEKQTNKKSEMHFNPKDLQQSCRGEQL